MLALATAAHSGHDPTGIFVLVAAAAAAIFGRSLLKVALPVILVTLVILLIAGASTVIHDLHTLLT
jgi:hypothetical protein